MSKEQPNEDPRRHTDWKNTKQTDQPWKGPVEREQRNEDRIDLEKWHDTNTYWPLDRRAAAARTALVGHREKCKRDPQLVASIH